MIFFDSFSTLFKDSPVKYKALFGLSQYLSQLFEIA